MCGTVGPTEDLIRYNLQTKAVYMHPLAAAYVTARLSGDAGRFSPFPRSMITCSVLLAFTYFGDCDWHWVSSDSMRVGLGRRQWRPYGS